MTVRLTAQEILERILQPTENQGDDQVSMEEALCQELFLATQNQLLLLTRSASQWLPEYNFLARIKEIKPNGQLYFENGGSLWVEQIGRIRIINEIFCNIFSEEKTVEIIFKYSGHLFPGLDEEGYVPLDDDFDTNQLAMSLPSTPPFLRDERPLTMSLPSTPPFLRDERPLFGGRVVFFSKHESGDILHRAKLSCDDTEPNMISVAYHPYSNATMSYDEFPAESINKIITIEEIFRSLLPESFNPDATTIDIIAQYSDDLGEDAPVGYDEQFFQKFDDDDSTVHITYSLDGGSCKCERCSYLADQLGLAPEPALSDPQLSLPTQKNGNCVLL